MDLGLSEEQEMLRNFARDFLEKECPESHVRDMEEDETGYSPELWRKMAEQGWKPEHVLQMKETGERLDVRLKKPVPLHFVYITAWATEDGVVQFRRDLYQKDGIGPTAAAY